MKKRKKYREVYRRSGKQKWRRNKKGKTKLKRKSRLEERHEEKKCYGSNEWSETAKICCHCKWHRDCGKVKHKLPGPQIIIPSRGGVI